MSCWAATTIGVTMVRRLGTKVYRRRYARSLGEEYISSIGAPVVEIKIFFVDQREGRAKPVYTNEGARHVKAPLLYLNK